MDPQQNQPAATPEPTPVTPTEPVAPATPAPDTSTAEWENAAKDFAIDKGLQPSEPAKPTEPAEPAKPEEKPAEATPAVPDNETPEQKAEREKKEAEAKPAEEPAPRDEVASRARSAQREMAAERQALAEDIRKELFSDVKNELLDSDGDPIRTVADVMKLVNPNTGKPFTSDEATMYLFEAQKHLDQTMASVEKQVEQIAETNLSLKDQSDNVLAKYGDLLKSMPGLRDQIWAEFSKTLEKDEKSGIITKAPVSLENFYDIALQPWAKMSQKLEADEAANAAAEAEKAKQQEEINQKKTQSDRGDIFSAGKSDTMDPEEKEWANAAKQYYEG